MFSVLHYSNNFIFPERLVLINFLSYIGRSLKFFFFIKNSLKKMLLVNGSIIRLGVVPVKVFHTILIIFLDFHPMQNPRWFKSINAFPASVGGWLAKIYHIHPCKINSFNSDLKFPGNLISCVFRAGILFSGKKLNVSVEFLGVKI